MIFMRNLTEQSSIFSSKLQFKYDIQTYMYTYTDHMF